MPLTVATKSVKPNPINFHPSLFTPWRDPVSGVESLILTARVAPVQQSFYYTNPSLTLDGRYLWVTCAFPPGRHKMLAVVDLEAGEIRLVPEAQPDGGAHIDPVTGDAYWTCGLELWRRGPRAADKPGLLNQFPAELAHGRVPVTLASHLTLSADGRSFAIDARFAREWIVGDLPLDGSPFRLWQSLDRMHDHAQFSPTDPDLILLPQDNWVDPVSGVLCASEDRLWTIRRGESVRPLLPQEPLPSANRGHEWWDADGEHVWFLDYTEGPRQGTKKINLRTGKVETVWPHGHSHSHADRTGRLLVGDIVSWPTDAWQVAFFNSVTQREVALVSQLPPCAMRGRYHIHPHPQFCCGDRYVCYTTNVLGGVDVALAPVAELVARTQAS